jgi:hypothetical protein
MSVIIDTCIISKFMNGIKISSIQLEKKHNPMLNINLLPVIHTGNRWSDIRLIQMLSDGMITFDALLENNL